MLSALLSRLFPDPTDEGDEPNDAPQSVQDAPIRTWEAIPSWGFTGWEVDTGGLTVEERQKALEGSTRDVKALTDPEESEETRQ